MQFYNQDITETPLLYVAHGVNQQGVFNKGVAKAIREKWPQAYKDYMKFYINYGNLGTSISTHIPGENEKIIGNLFTQCTYGNTGVHATYLNVLLALKDFIETHKAKRVAIPRIGCSLGGLSFEIMVVLLRELENITGCEFHVYHVEK